MKLFRITNISIHNACHKAISRFVFIFAAILFCLPSNAQQKQEFQTFESYADVGYNQELRPQFHFTSLKGWNNDPNGLVWYDGEYHMFFQHNPMDVVWGNMTWGHAISTDMLHWEQLPHAILPYDGGTIFSGTAIVDHDNHLGMQSGETKTMVSFFSFAKKPFYQAAAYSSDRGRTFNLYNEGEPVVPNQGFYHGERDPKVFWHEESGRWVMALWVQQGEPGTVRFFTSENLSDWEIASDFRRDWLYECIDLVELAVDGDPKNKRWLIYDASFDYEIGQFDGEVFTSDGSALLGDLGQHYYAGQTFNDSPDDRTVVIGWMRIDNDSPFIATGMPFNQQMGFPMTMELRTTPEGIRLFRWPIDEIESLYEDTIIIEEEQLSFASNALADFEAELVDLSIEVRATTNEFSLHVRGLEIRYDDEAFHFGETTLPAPANKGVIKLRLLLDKASLEMFANEGAAVSTDYAVAAKDDHSFRLSADGEVFVNRITINSLSSIWP